MTSGRKSASDETRFEFGRNWLNFVRTAVDDERIDQAAKSIRVLLKVDSLADKTFLDIGCGSGLFSLAACRLGAKEVMGFDYDPESVQASTELRTKYAIPADKWRITQGSILDESFLSTLEPADVVYSYGVLHCTGDMWRAIKLASTLVKPSGIFYFAVGNHVEKRLWGSRYWIFVKRTYCRSPSPIQAVMRFVYAGYLTMRILGRFGNPIREAKEYKRFRGMSLWHDWMDWLGGYPYEDASAGEVFEYVSGLGGFRLVSLRTTSALANNEFVFLSVPE